MSPSLFLKIHNIYCSARTTEHNLLLKEKKWIFLKGTLLESLDGKDLSKDLICMWLE